MTNFLKNKEYVPYFHPWELAYAARELRQRRAVTLSCPINEAGLVIEQLKSFSNCSPHAAKTVNKPNSHEVFIEIIDTFN